MPTHPTIFSSSLPNAGIFVDGDQYKARLFFGLLFEPDGWGFPDVYFFNENVIGLLNKTLTPQGGSSWFFEAVKTGLIVPYVRGEKLQGFRASLMNLRELRLQGPYYTESAETVADTLDDARPPTWKLWPPDPEATSRTLNSAIARVFDGALNQARMIDILRTRTLQEYPHAVVEIDKHISYFLDAVGRAKRRIPGQLRATYIMEEHANVLVENDHQSINMTNIEKLKKFEDLICAPKLPEIEYLFRSFYELVMHLYNNNIAECQGMRKNAFEYNDISHTLLELFPDEEPSPYTVHNEGPVDIVDEVELPKLLDMDEHAEFETIVTLRRTGSFDNYKLTQSKFLSDPTKANAYEHWQCLLEYIKLINKTFYDTTIGAEKYRASVQMKRAWSNISDTLKDTKVSIAFTPNMFGVGLIPIGSLLHSTVTLASAATGFIVTSYKTAAKEELGAWHQTDVIRVNSARKTITFGQAT